MPILIVQQGHCFRKKGATGTNGEQEYAVRVANACARLQGGWVVNRTLADENDYRADAFVAIHCDGSARPAPRKAQRWHTTDVPAQRVLERCQGGVDVVDQKDLDNIPFAPGGEIPPGVL